MSSTSNGSSRAKGARIRTARAAAGPRRGLAGIVQRQVAALNSRDLDSLMALYAEDAMLEFPASPAVSGRAAIREAFARFFQDWDEEIVLQRVIAAGQTVAAEGTAQGRHRTLHLRIPGRTPLPQRAYRHGFAVFLEIQRGKIRRHRVYYDSRDLVRQLLGGG